MKRQPTNMLKLWIIYDLLIVVCICLLSIAKIEKSSSLILPILLLPLIYYLVTDYKRLLRKSAKLKHIIDVDISKSTDHPVEPAESGVVVNQEGTNDTDRRLFLKLIGSTGLSLFFMAVLGKKSAQAAFFGSVPGPGTVAIKDSTGAQIDPAEKQPTDGYTISEIDDSTSPSYYGFIHKTGAWYITKEDSSGGYRYAKGSSSFSTNWTSRASLAYDYFDAVF